MVLIAAACGSGPKQVAPYAYPGCDDSTAKCPGQAAFTCALDAIAAKHGSCVGAADCAAATGPDFGTCSLISPCQKAAVTKAEDQAYGEEAKVEVLSYCSLAGCNAFPYCPRPDNATLDCVDGRCKWVQGVWLFDAGAH
jgi:hypothetical protein